MNRANEPNEAAEARLRTMFRDAAAQVRPTRPGPDLDATPGRAPRSAVLRLSLGLALCLAVAGAVTVAVHPWGGSGSLTTGDGTSSGGVLLTADSDGSVVFRSPDTGAVLRTLVGPSPVDSQGRHLSRPDAVTAAGQVAYVAYESPQPVIESIPFSGGTPNYVGNGMDPAASPDGTQLAFYRLGNGSSSSGGSVTGSVIVRSLAAGTDRAWYSPTGIIALSTLSWSSDDTDLALSGLFYSSSTESRPLLNALSGVQLLNLDAPVSATNPHFAGAPTPISTSGATTWTDGQFLGTGHSLGVLVSQTGGLCQQTSTGVLSVDTVTGATTPVTDLPFSVPRAIYDAAGNLVGFQRELPSAPCPATTTTTTTTTLPGSTSSTGGGAFSFSPATFALYRWSDGQSTRLADGVSAVTYVAQGL